MQMRLTDGGSRMMDERCRTTADGALEGDTVFLSVFFFLVRRNEFRDNGACDARASSRFVGED